VVIKLSESGFDVSAGKLVLNYVTVTGHASKNKAAIDKSGTGVSVWVWVWVCAWCLRVCGRVRGCGFVDPCFCLCRALW
jgi:hypothetical protein